MGIGSNILSRTRTQSLRDWTVTLNGVIYSGFADGEAFRLEPMEAEQFATVVGADGVPERFRKANDMWTLTLRLQETNPLNSTLSAFHEADKAGTGPGACAVRHNAGTSSFAAASAWVVGYPAVSVGTDASPREWAVAGKFVAHVGGSTR